MARRESSLDPSAGPLQEFAFHLRKVRTEAGNPTYRALARIAGYSATTLSEAARGTRQPTLDVVLAYVGACRGDLDEWRRRWSELEAALSPSPPEPVPPPQREPEIPGGPVPLEGAEPPGKPALRRLALVAAALLLLLAGVAAAGWRPEQKPAAEPSCPRMPATRVFTGETYGGGAPVRAGATPDEPVLSTIPSHCTLGFVGFCLGAKMRDATSGTPDIRWFMLSGGTVVPSAVIHGNPPATLAPARCGRDRPGPGAIALEIAADAARPGGILARASGHNLDIVGFAARVATASAQWQQIALTGPDFHATWHPDPPIGTVTVVAAACLGGGSPTRIMDVRTLPPGGAGAASRPRLAPPELTAAARSACKYPRA